MDALRLPFWEMIGTAEAIVIGEREGWSVSDGEYLALAQVHVLERLKGVASGRLLVPADPTWSERLVRYLGARPFRREPHVRIQILFLAPASAHLRYRSLIDWGVIEPSLADLAVFRETILEAVALSAKARPTPRQVQAWLVRCSSRRATRGHCIWGLKAGEWLQPTHGSVALTRAERQVLMNGFSLEPSTDDTFPRLLDLVVDEPNSAFDLTAARAMEALLRAKRGPYWLGATFYMLMRRWGVPNMDERIEHWPRNGLDLYPRFTQLRDTWAGLRREGRLPRAEPVTPVSAYVDSGWIDLSQ